MIHTSKNTTNGGGTLYRCKKGLRVNENCTEAKKNVRGKLCSPKNNGKVNDSDATTCATGPVQIQKLALDNLCRCKKKLESQGKLCRGKICMRRIVCSRKTGGEVNCAMQKKIECKGKL